MLFAFLLFYFVWCYHYVVKNDIKVNIKMPLRISILLHFLQGTFATILQGFLETFFYSKKLELMASRKGYIETYRKSFQASSAPKPMEESGEQCTVVFALLYPTS